MSKRLHFESLDGLRFFAFFKVYLLHVPIVGAAFPIFSFLKAGGGIGVSFFFVLSGFLITYLLVHEKIQTNSISLKKFFVRRSFRIWPLYFLIMVIIYCFPLDFKTLYLGYNSYAGGYELDWRYSFSFLENYKMLATDTHPSTSTIRMFWSLCIEEHFYIFWVIALFMIPARRTIYFLGGSIIVGIAARLIEHHITGNQRIESNDLFTNLSFFAIGGILGFYIATAYEKTMAFLNTIPAWIRIAIISLVVLFVVFQGQLYPYLPGTVSHAFRSSVIAILFTIAIAMFLPKHKWIRFSKNNPLSYLGRISYGLYVYHVFVIDYMNVYCKNHNILMDNWTNMSLFIGVSMGGSILLASGSYFLFERPFLRWRERLT